jgi:two-component system chemotaxis response regulator CheB
MKVMIVDDSIVFRSAIRQALETQEGIEVIASVTNGKQAIDKFQVFKDIDLVILDLEMPVMDGVSTIKEFKRMGIDVGIIVFSAFSQAGAEKTMQALTAGAHDFLPKTNNDEDYEDGNEYIVKNLVPKMLSLHKSRNYKKLNLKKEISSSSPTVKLPDAKIKKMKLEAICIGSSTGGPDALKKLFSMIDQKPNIPIFITQHMPKMFTRQLAEMLDRNSDILNFKEAEDGELVIPNRVYVAPGDYHLTFKNSLEGIKISLNQNNKVNSVRPSVDVMIDSASNNYNLMLNVILTGMGEDGLKSCVSQRNKGNPVLIQDEKSCVVFGMPGALYRANSYDQMGDLEYIASILNKKWGGDL